MKKPSICFVAPKAYSALSQDPEVRHIGGAEVQQALIARGLAARGYRVSFVTLDHGQPDGQDLGGITVYRAYRPAAGIAGLRFIHPRITKVWAAMKRANADIYYQRTSDPLTGIAAAFCRRHRRRFVFGVANNVDVTPDLPDCGTLRERVLYQYGLRRADRVIAQTFFQQRLARESFGIESTVIPNAAASSPASQTVSDHANGERPSALWIGRFAGEKRLNWLLDVAHRCPGIRFDVVGDGRPDPAVTGLKDRATRMPNVRLLGYVSHREMEKCYEGASALICTSSVEGFPNTFLEAWTRGLPVVTTFDPDGIVAANGLGICADTVESLAEAVRAVCSDVALRSRLGGCAREYYLAHHTIDVALDAFDRLFRDLAADAHRS